MYVISILLARNCDCELIDDENNVYDKPLSRQRRFLSIWNTEEEAERPFVRYPQKVIRHYPIWRIHKYNGIDLKPMPVSLVKRHPNDQQKGQTTKYRLPNGNDYFQYPVVSNENRGVYINPRQNTREEQNQLEALAREIGITDVKTLPKMEEVMQLLGTATEDDTIDAVRELASTPEGVDMIKSFLKDDFPADPANYLESLNGNINDENAYVNEPVAEFSENQGREIPFVEPPIEHYNILPYEHQTARPFNSIEFFQNKNNSARTPVQQPQSASQVQQHVDPVLRNGQQFQIIIPDVEQSRITRIPAPNRVYGEPPRIRIPHEEYGLPTNTASSISISSTSTPIPTTTTPISTTSVSSTIASTSTTTAIPEVQEQVDELAGGFISGGGSNSNLDFIGIQGFGAGSVDSFGSSLNVGSNQNSGQFYAPSTAPLTEQQATLLSGISSKFNRFHTDVGLAQKIIPSVVNSADEGFLEKLKRLGNLFSFTSAPEIELISTTPKSIPYVHTPYIPAHTLYVKKSPVSANTLPSRTSYVQNQHIGSIEIPKTPSLTHIPEIEGLRNTPDIPEIPTIHIQQGYPIPPQRQRGAYLRVKYPLNGFNPIPTHKMPARPFTYISEAPPRVISDVISAVPSPELVSHSNTNAFSNGEYDIPEINHLPLEQDDLSVKSPRTSFGTPIINFNREDVQNDRGFDEQSPILMNPKDASIQRRSSNLVPRRISPHDFYATGTLFRANPEVVEKSIPTVFQGRSFTKQLVDKTVAESDFDGKHSS